MKAIFRYGAVLLCTTFSFTLSAQDTSENVSSHRNEFAFEITNLIERVNGALVQGDPDPFEVSYRRIFNKGNLRARLGVGVSSFEAAFETIPDERFTVTNSSLVARLGYEWVSDIGARWQVFYGIDGVFSNLVEEDLLNTGNLYVVRNRIQQRGVGVSPVLGVRFKLHERVSLLTDVNYRALILEQKVNDNVIWNDPDFTQEVNLPLERVIDLTEVEFSPVFYLRLAVRL